MQIENTQITTTGKKADAATLSDIVVEAVRDLKGKDITVIDLDSLETAPASRFVICQGKSTTQVGSIADNIVDKVREATGIKPYNIDGTRNSQWVVVDYGSVMVHVFLPETHDLYNLEDLWSDASIEVLPDID